MVMTTGRSSDSQGAAPTKAASAPPAGLHRIIRLHAIDGEVRGALEDDFHHFRVLIRHDGARVTNVEATALRSEEHTSELQSLMRISYAVFCLKKKNKDITIHTANT